MNVDLIANFPLHINNGTHLRELGQQTYELLAGALAMAAKIHQQTVPNIALLYHL